VPRQATDVISFPSFHLEVIKVTMTPEGLWGKGFRFVIIVITFSSWGM